jgi:hypothetical protein
MVDESSNFDSGNPPRLRVHNGAPALAVQLVTVFVGPLSTWDHHLAPHKLTCFQWGHRQRSARRRIFSWTLSGMRWACAPALCVVVVVAAAAVIAAWPWDFSKSPRSNPPLRKGRLDFLKSPRSNPPLLESQLDFLKSPRSKGGGSTY